MKGMLAAERLRLASSRSTWWCLAVVTVLSLGTSAVVARTLDLPGEPVTTSDVLASGSVGQLVLLLLSAFAVTSEYKHGTIRHLYQALPARWPVIAAKAVTMAVAGALIGLVLAFASLVLAAVLSPRTAGLAPDTTAEWRQIIGVGLVYAFSAIIGVAMGGLVRNGAASVAVLLVWMLVAEGLVGSVPGVGRTIADWMPFTALGRLVDPAEAGRASLGLVGTTLYAACLAAVLLALAAVMVRRKDP